MKLLASDLRALARSSPMLASNFSVDPPPLSGPRLETNWNPRTNQSLSEARLHYKTSILCSLPHVKSSPGVAALPFLGLLVGVILGCLLITYVTKTRFARKLKEHGKVIPEERLIPMIIASILPPIVLFWFGWTSSRSVSWVPGVIAGVPVGLDILVIFLQGYNYIIDVYMMFANSAIAANTLVHSAFAGAFPLFTSQMYKRLGTDWASSLLGFITVAMIPIPLLFFFYGKKLRNMSNFTPKF